MSTAEKLKNEVVTKTETTLALAPEVNSEQIEASDVILPALYLMQKMSEWVGEEKAKAGQYVKSVGEVVVGGRGQGVEFVPLSFTKTFRIVNSDGNKWVRNEPWNPAKAQEWEFEEDGMLLKRVKCINVYALLLKEVIAEAAEKASCAKSGDMFDLEKALTPVLITFRSTSHKAGKILTDHFAKAQQYKAEPYVTTFKLDSHEESNDDGSYYVADVTSSGKTSKEYFETASFWRALILKGRTKVAEAEETGSASEGPAQF